MKLVSRKQAGQTQKPNIYSSKLAEFLQAKFGLELTFHAAAGKPAYGYTLIDHSRKAVYKGSEVLNLQKLLAPVSQQAQKEAIDTMISKAIKAGMSLSKLMRQLQSKGLELDKKGHITSLGKLTSKLSETDIRALKEHENKELVKGFRAHNALEKAALAQYLGVSSDSIRIDKDAGVDKHYQTLVQALLGQYASLSEGYRDYGLMQIKYKGQAFILDRAGGYIASAASLSLQDKDLLPANDLSQAAAESFTWTGIYISPDQEDPVSRKKKKKKQQIKQT